jgi:hypothetical protein
VKASALSEIASGSALQHTIEDAYPSADDMTVDPSYPAVAYF